MSLDENVRPLSQHDVTQLLADLPPPSQTKLSQDDVASHPVLVVLDDDPTGTQTCHDVNVLTVWDAATLLDEFKSNCNGFFILTNSRALPPIEARKLIQVICTAVKKAAEEANKKFEVVLRGDSTLRGHFPDEPEAAEEVLGEAGLWVLAPFFEQGGRVTINDIHYIANPDGSLVPAAQTPFAKDATFGYTQSNLKEYIREKSNGRISNGRIHSISLKKIRSGGATQVCEELMSLPRRSVVFLNAVVTADMDVFVQGLLQARSQGRSFIYRTGAAFVSSRLAIRQMPPLSAEALNMDLGTSAPGGLIIAGSYVPKTTEQLESLVSGRGEKLNTIILEVDELLQANGIAQRTIAAAAEKASMLISGGKDVLLMTSRKLIVGGDQLSSLKIDGVVAESLVQFLRMVTTKPRYVIAKGGITSSDAATKGLLFKRAKICGQAAPGVPLWMCEESTSKWPGIPYVVFPGNVGQADTLRDLVASWSIAP